MNSKTLTIIFSFFILIFISLVEPADIYSAAKKTKTVKKPSGYKIPSRAIIVSPYATYIFAKDLYVDTIEDQSGFGGGINIRTQIYKGFGYIIDVFGTNLDIIKDETANESELGLDYVTVFSGGFYYALPDWKIDLCYGAITAGEYVMTIFIPGIEYYKAISSRFSLFGKLSYLITNDWIADVEYEEHYTSFAFSAGISVIF